MIWAATGISLPFQRLEGVLPRDASRRGGTGRCDAAGPKGQYAILKLLADHGEGLPEQKVTLSKDTGALDRLLERLAPHPPVVDGANRKNSVSGDPGVRCQPEYWQLLSFSASAP
jgi:hypothetical protein